MIRSRGRSHTALRTLHFYWRATMLQWPIFLCAILTTLGFVFFVSYVNPLIVGKIVDLVGVGNVQPSEVYSVFGPYMILLVVVNVVGQACGKLQEFFTMKVDIHANYELSTLVFETLSNQSMA